MCRWLVLSIIMVGTARAAPDDLIARPLVLDAGQLDAQVVGEIDVTEQETYKPVSLAPDVWFGVLPTLTVGLIHSNASVDRITSGASFCVHTGGTPPAECDHFYHGSGIDLLWSAVSGQFAVAPRVRVLVRDFEPLFKPAVTIGAAIRWTSGRYAIASDPYVQIGLGNNRNGNYSSLLVPIVASIQPTYRWSLDLITGWNADFEFINDDWRVPVALGTRVRATDHLDLSAVFGFTEILGPQNTPKERVVFLTAGWRT